MKIYIVLSSWNEKGNTDIRKIEGTYTNLQAAQNNILDSINNILQYEGDTYCIASPEVEMDIANSNHNGAKLRFSNPDCHSAWVADSEDAPEHKIEWEIEEHELIENTPEENAEYPMDSLKALKNYLASGNRDVDHPVIIRDKGIAIYQVLDGRGYFDTSTDFYVRKMWISDNDRVYVEGNWSNGRQETFALEHQMDEDMGEESWWNGLSKLAELCLNLNKKVG